MNSFKISKVFKMKNGKTTLSPLFCRFVMLLICEYRV